MIILKVAKINIEHLKQGIDHNERDIANNKVMANKWRNLYHRILVFVLFFLGYIGFFATKTMLFEAKGNLVEYKVCIEQEYGRQGSFCVDWEMIRKPLVERLNEHIVWGFIWSLGVGIAWFWFSENQARRYRDGANRSSVYLEEYKKNLEEAEKELELLQDPKKRAEKEAQEKRQKTEEKKQTKERAIQWEKESKEFDEELKKLFEKE